MVCTKASVKRTGKNVLANTIFKTKDELGCVTVLLCFLLLLLLLLFVPEECVYDVYVKTVTLHFLVSCCSCFLSKMLLLSAFSHFSSVLHLLFLFLICNFLTTVSFFNTE